jgi:hypothetical protein
MKRALILCSAALALLFAACLTGTDVEIQDLTGEWVATKITYVEAKKGKRASANLTLMGYGAEMTITADGAFTLEVDDGDDDFTIQGAITTDRNRLTTTIDGVVYDGEVFLEGDLVSFQISGGVSYDFVGDGVEVPAGLNLVMNRAM